MEIKKVKMSALKLNDRNPRLIKDFKIESESADSVESKEKEPKVCPHCGKEIK